MAKKAIDTIAAAESACRRAEMEMAEHTKSIKNTARAEAEKIIQAAERERDRMFLEMRERAKCSGEEIEKIAKSRAEAEIKRIERIAEERSEQAIESVMAIMLGERG